MESQLSHKDNVIASVTEDYVALKKRTDAIHAERERKLNVALETRKLNRQRNAA